MKPFNQSKIALPLLLLLVLAGLLPESSRASVAVPNAIVTTAVGAEAEPNNTYQTASFIQLEQLGGNQLHKTMLGTIDSPRPTITAA